MEKDQVLFQNVTPADFENFQVLLSSEEYSVFRTSIDTFNMLVLNMHAAYNRNQNTLTLTFDYQKDYEAAKDQLKKDVLAISGKEDVSGQLQSKPVETEFNQQTGQVVEPEPPPTQEEQQVKNDKDPLAPIQRDVKPVPPVSVIPDSPTGEKVLADAKSTKKEEPPKKDESSDKKEEPAKKK